jgi:hypothetical protein
MNSAVSSTGPRPLTIWPSKSTTMKSLARTSDQCNPKGTRRNRSERPGSNSVKWLSMPSFNPKCAAKR